MVSAAASDSPANGAAAPAHALPLSDAAAVTAFGAALGAALRPGDVLALSGPLGAGKTTLARGVVAAWTGDVGAETPSPTYLLVQGYEGPRGLLQHLDLYRLRGAEEAFELGLEDMLGQDALVIEWPERLGPYLPARRCAVALSAPEAGGRIAEARDLGGCDLLARPAAAQFLKDLKGGKA